MHWNNFLNITQPFPSAPTTMILKQTNFLEQTNQLILACINGDRYSQNQLYELFARKMFALCLRYSHNREEAEEIVQEGFVQVFRSLHNFRFNGSFEGWIRRIMVNCSVQHYRSKSKMHVVVNLDTSNVEEIGDEDISAQIGKKELLKMIQSLSPAYRMVFNLYVFEGMKHHEIAALLGIAEGTSKSNLSDAKAILKKAVTNSLKVAKRNV